MRGRQSGGGIVHPASLATCWAGALIASVAVALADEAAQTLPEYDTEAYCAEVAEIAGGSYSLEKGCRDMEAEARTSLEGRVVEPRIMKYCDDVALMTGGSYSMLEGCIDMEEEARDSLSQ